MGPLRRIAQSLKFKVTAGAIGSLAVGMSIVAVLLLTQTERDILQAQRQRQLSETARTAQMLSRRIIDLQRALKVTASDLDVELLGSSDAMAAFVKAQPVLREVFDSVYVISDTGRMLVLQQKATISFPGTDLANRPYVQKTLEVRRPVISEPVFSRVTGTPLIAFTYPVLKNGKVVGMLAASLSLSSRELIGDVSDGDESGSVLVVTDMAGRMLAHPNTQRILKPLAKEARLHEAFGAWIASGSPAEPAGLSFPQTDEVVSVAAVSGTEWLVWRASPATDFVAPLRAARTRAIGMVVALLIAISIFVFLWMAYLLRPLRNLSDRAQTLFNGVTDPLAGWPAVQSSARSGRVRRALRPLPENDVICRSAWFDSRSSALCRYRRNNRSGGIRFPCPACAGLTAPTPCSANLASTRRSPC